MKMARRLVTLFAGLVTSGVLTTTAPANAADEVYLLANAHSGLCMDVAYGSVTRGARVQQWTCYGGTPEQWRFVGLGNGVYNIVNKNSNKCLDLPNGNWATPPGVALQQWDCWAGVMQQWTLRDDGTGRKQIVSVANPNLCVDAKDSSTTPGSTIQAWTCWNGNVQKWNRIRTS